MNLQDLYDKIKVYALNTQNVESFTIGDPYTVFNSLHMVYGAFNVNLNYIRRIDNFEVFNITFYCADKLKNDSSNLFEIQSSCYNALVNVIGHLKEDYQLDDYSDIQFYPFWQQFSDLLAGFYCEFNLYIPIEDICENYDKIESGE